MYKDNKNGKIGIIVTVIVLICLVIITNLDNNILSKIVNPFTKITMSAQSGVAYLKNKLSKNNEYFVTQDELKSQNSELKTRERVRQIKEKAIRNKQARIGSIKS